MDQLAGLGNAVVPQVSEWIGRRIVESLQMERA
jgi:site-specific DNA-cytosine methylase